MRQHHICFSQESYDPSGQQVLDNVKHDLLKFRKKNDFDGISKFIPQYLTSLLEYVRAFNEIVAQVTTSADYYKIFSVLGLSAAYYPVVTMLKKRDFLDKPLASKGLTVLKLVEMIDVRVMKVRQYAGRKDIAEFSYHLNNKSMSIKDASDQLLWFNSHKISDDRFRDALANNDLYSQTGLLRLLFIDYSERLVKKDFDLAGLKKIMEYEPTIEHILSQTPNFKPRAFSFKNDEDFQEHENIIGNLTLLEKRINSSIKNQDLVEKVKGYSKSKFKITSELATRLATGGAFKKEDLRRRNDELVNDFSKRWSA